MQTFIIERRHPKTGKPVNLPVNVQAASVNEALGLASRTLWKPRTTIKAIDPMTGESAQFTTR